MKEPLKVSQKEKEFYGCCLKWIY